MRHCESRNGAPARSEARLRSAAILFLPSHDYRWVQEERMTSMALADLAAPAPAVAVAAAGVWLPMTWRASA